MAAIRRHSALQLAKPRREKRPARRLFLIWAKTGSISAVTAWAVQPWTKPCAGITVLRPRHRATSPSRFGDLRRLLELPLRTSLDPGTMESLEIIVLPIILMGVLLLGAIWTTTLGHWLRSTKPLR